MGWGAVLGGLVWDDRMSGIRHKTFQRKPRNRLIIIIIDAADGPKWVVISFFVLLYLLRIFRIKSWEKKEPGDKFISIKSRMVSHSAEVVAG